LNIVLYSSTFLPTLGGREFVVHHLANSLIELGHRVRVLGPSGLRKHRGLKLPYPVHRWPMLRGPLAEQLKLAELAMDTAIWGCDVIHAHTTHPNGYTALRLKRLWNLPLVITPHGVDIQTIADLGYGKRLDPILDKKIVQAVRGAEVTTAISKTIQSLLIEAGAHPDRVRHIPNGVDMARFEVPPAPDIRTWLGVDADARLLVTVGKYNPRKGQEYAVRAMPKVLSTEPRARLIIVGQNTEKLLPLIAELGLEGRVVLTGGVPPPPSALLGGAARAASPSEPDRYAEILCSSELYVSAGTERDAEGLSLAVLEAMAARLPIVATAISGNVDVVRDGNNGVLVEPANVESLANGIIRVLAAPEAQAKMRSAARETASQHAWINMARQYVEAYEDAIAAARRNKQ
jgi:glycosyltransferase involved in cell wall biosynthesis